jgi:hypothetical protein
MILQKLERKERRWEKGDLQKLKGKEEVRIGK